MSKIVLALSGGVDSAVAAWLLKRDGFLVHGLFMKHPYQREDETDALRLAEFLDIPLTILDVAEAFEPVVEDFTDEYFRGRTPNPCVFCNRMIKFGKLFDFAVEELKADFFSTGHYVRLGEWNGMPALFRAMDDTKDQSYVLYGIERRKLSKLRFPLGDLNKTEVRRIAGDLGFPNEEKKESQDICFVERGRQSEFLHARRPGVDTSGRFVTPTGEFLALHGGYEQFTVGQRKGMGVGFGKRVFVLRLNAETREVVIGDWDALAVHRMRLSDVRWLVPVNPDAPFHCDVKVRYRCQAIPATVRPEPNGSVSVEFESAQYGVAPGQSAVFYTDDRLLGGGVIQGN